MMILYAEEHVNTEYEKVISFFIYMVPAGP